MSAHNTKTSPQVMRALEVLDALAGFAATGASNKDLSTALRTSATNITRVMHNLIAKGWARKSEENERFYPTARFMELPLRAQADLDREQQRLTDRRRAMTGV